MAVTRPASVGAHRDDVSASDVARCARSHQHVAMTMRLGQNRLCIHPITLNKPAVPNINTIVSNCGFV